MEVEKMSDVLDQWEAEAKLKPSTDDYFELYERILALIELVRKKDEKLRIITKFLYSTDHFELTCKFGAMIMTANDALAFTEELK